MKIKLYPKELLEAAWKQDKKLYAHGDAAAPPKCLRCGAPLAAHLMVNALSRYVDVQICDACGMDEALRDASHAPLPLAEWDAVKSGHLKKKRKSPPVIWCRTALFRGVQAHLQASNAAHRTPRQRTCLFPFGLRWIPLVDNLAQ